jgi:hypothetical protein
LVPGNHSVCWSPVRSLQTATGAENPVASPARTAPGELAIRLAVALAVQDVRAQRGGGH